MSSKLHAWLNGCKSLKPHYEENKLQHGGLQSHESQDHMDDKRAL